jgi:hypothetical protein
MLHDHRGLDAPASQVALSIGPEPDRLPDQHLGQVRHHRSSGDAIQPLLYFAQTTFTTCWNGAARNRLGSLDDVPISTVP